MAPPAAAMLAGAAVPGMTFFVDAITYLSLKLLLFCLL